MPLSRVATLKDASVLAVISLVSGILGSYFNPPASDYKTIVVISVIATLGGFSLASTVDVKMVSTATRVVVISVSVILAIAAVLCYVRVSQVEGNDWDQFVKMALSIALAFLCFGIIIRTSGLRLGDKKIDDKP